MILFVPASSLKAERIVHDNDLAEALLRTRTVKIKWPRVLGARQL